MGKKRKIAAFIFGGLHAAAVFLVTGLTWRDWPFWLLMIGVAAMQLLQHPWFDDRP